MSGCEMLVDEIDVSCTCGEFQAPNDPDRDAAWEEHVNETWYPDREGQPEFNGAFG